MPPRQMGSRRLFKLSVLCVSRLLLVYLQVLCCWVLVPAWLLALRHEVAIGHVQDAVLIGLGGLVWLLAAANCYQRAAQAKSAVSRTTVTAAQLEDVLPGTNGWQ